MTPQDLSGGVLQLVILEGKVEKVLFNGQESGALDMALPDSSGKVLNLRDIEQGLDQVNRLSRYNAQIKLLPSAQQGYSIVDIQSAPHKFGSVGAGFNNNGQKSTGEQQISLSVTADNLFKRLDRGALLQPKALPISIQKTPRASILALTSLTVIGMSVFAPLTAPITPPLLIRASHLIHRVKPIAMISTLNGCCSEIAPASLHLEPTLNTAEKKLHFRLSCRSQFKKSLFCCIKLGTQYHLAGGFLSVAPKIAIGTDWFGGEETLSSDPALPDAEFVKGSLTASYTYPIAPSLTMTSTLFGQWSNDTLYGAERISIGGEYSVRGFKGTSSPVMKAITGVMI